MAVGHKNYVGIEWPVLNNCTEKFHQFERVTDSLMRVSSADQWTAFAIVAYFIRPVSFYCVDITVTMYLFESTWMILWIVNYCPKNL